MDNQHRKINGYMELTQEDIDLINEIKVKEAEFLLLVKKVKQNVHARASSCPEALDHATKAGAYRWAVIGQTDIETASMALVRAVGQSQPLDLEGNNG